MKKLQSEYFIEDISNLPQIKLSESILTIMQEKIMYRRKRVNQLRLLGYTNKEIATKIRCKLSTIEKDNHAIRESSRQWFENDAVTEYCEFLHNAVVLYDCGIEELHLLYVEETNSEIKIRIWLTIADFEVQKMNLLEKTDSVQRYLRGELS
jgi:DNA-binding CsgD family transcriptional regulator